MYVSWLFYSKSSHNCYWLRRKQYAQFTVRRLLSHYHAVYSWFIASDFNEILRTAGRSNLIELPTTIVRYLFFHRRKIWKQTLLSSCVYIFKSAKKNYFANRSNETFRLVSVLRIFYIVQHNIINVFFSVNNKFSTELFVMPSTIWKHGSFQASSYPEHVWLLHKLIIYSSKIHYFRGYFYKLL